MATVRTKRASVRLIAKRWPVCMRSSRLTQGFFIMEKPTPVAVTIRKALSIPSLATVQQRVASELSIFRLRIVQCVVQTAALFATQGRINAQCRHFGKIAQVQKVHLHFEVPIKSNRTTRMMHEQR